MLTLSEIPKLQIYRHEKQNFVEVMQGYVSVLISVPSKILVSA